MLGTPDATVWPGIEELPDWQPGFPKWQRQDLTQARLPQLLLSSDFPGARCEDACSLMTHTTVLGNST